MSKMILYDYPNSSACYRVRIILALKGLAYEKANVSLILGDQASDAYRAVNPQMLVPMLVVDGVRLTQSLAIADYLDRQYPEPPLLPADPAARAHALAMAMAIIADIHPIQNLRVLKHLDEDLGHGPEIRPQWAAHWIATGFAALEAMVPATPWLAGEAPGLPDLCLVPQMNNARRFKVDLAPYPRLVAADEKARAHPAFIAAAPGV